MLVAMADEGKRPLQTGVRELEVHARIGSGWQLAPDPGRQRGLGRSRVARGELSPRKGEDTIGVAPLDDVAVSLVVLFRVAQRFLDHEHHFARLDSVR